MEIRNLQLGSYQTNCYIVWDEGRKDCVVIDPGYQPEYVLEQVRSLGKTVEAILLTHGHFDHVGAVEELVSSTGCALWMHEADLRISKNATTNFLYPLLSSQLSHVHFCTEGDQISVDGLTFSVLHTPGHTPGCVCHCAEDAMFCGDTLFAGSCGRIDLPGGDRAVMAATLARLASLKTDFRIFPGHGPSSTLTREQASNPYLLNS